MASSVLRRVLGNLPPTGRGVYARAQGVDFLGRFDFVALVASRGDTRSKAPALRDAGREVWLYDMPSGWMPTSNFESTVARFEALCDSLGAVGYIADPETGWVGGGRVLANEGQIVALTKALAGSIARGYRVGVTSFPEMSLAQRFAASGAWGSPQLYRPSDIRLYDRWVGWYGRTMTLPSVSLWAHPQEYTFTPDNYPGYLDALPAALGAVGWTTDVPPSWMMAAYQAWEPWQGSPTRIALWLASRLSTPLGIAVAVVLGLILAVVAWKVLRHV